MNLWSKWYRPYAYDVTEGRPAALGVKRNTATCVIAKHAARGANPASHTAGLARPGPRTERLSANAHCQHNTCALRDTRLASLLWRCDPLWRQCIRSITKFVTMNGHVWHNSGIDWSRIIRGIGRIFNMEAKAHGRKILENSCIKMAFLHIKCHY